MKTKKAFLLIFLNLAFLLGCKSQSQGYDNLDSLYADFVNNLKSSDENLKQYCYKIVPDEGTIKYLEKNNFSYRGIPDELKKQNIDIKVIGDKYYEEALMFKKRFPYEWIQNIKYIGREELGEELFDEKLGIYMTETLILLKTGDYTIKCKLGEMLKMDGKWKSFTAPKFNI